MSLTQALHVVLYEGAGSEPLPAEMRLNTITTLLERGFALTRDPEFAREFRDTDARIPTALAGLRTAMSENPTQRELLEKG